MVFWTGRRLDLVWGSIRDIVVDAVGRADFDESMELFEDEFGFNPNKDLFPLLNGAWAMGLTSSSTAGFAGEFGIDMGFLGLFELAADAEMVDLVSSFSRELENQGLEIDRFRSDDLTAFELSEGSIPMLAYGAGKDLLLIGGSGDELEEAVTRRGGESLSEDERYVETWREFPSGMAPVFYVDVQRLQHAIRGGLSDDQTEKYEQMSALFDPVSVIAMAAEIGRIDIWHQTILVFIDTEQVYAG